MTDLIRSVEVFDVPVPFKHSFVLGNGAVGGAGRDGDVIFVRITTDEGVVGWGEQRALPSWSYETRETIVSVIEKYLAPLIVGTSPFDVEGFHHRAAKALSPSVSNGFPFARAAVDLALHDAAGKIAGLPVSELLGGRRHHEIPLCSAIGVGEADEVAERVQGSSDYHAFKIKIPGDVDRAATAVTTAIEHANGKPIWLDANQSFRPAALWRLMRRIADEDTLACIEQPVPSTDWAGMRRVREQGFLPVAIDEGSFSASDLARTVALEAADLVVVKICKSGGLRQAHRTAAVAEAHGLELLSSGLTDCGVGFAAALHLFSLYDLALPAELNGPELLADMWVDGLVIKDGIAQVPTAPGLGIEVDEDRIRAASRR